MAEVLKADLKTYTQYVGGSIYFFSIEDKCKCCGSWNPRGDVGDSVGGYYSIEDAMSEGIAAADIKKLLAEQLNEH